MTLLTPIVNPVSVIIQRLTADSAVSALVGSRVYGPPGIPEGQALAAMIDVAPLGTGRELSLPLMRFEFQVRCWNTTAAGAWQVYQAVANCLHRTGVTHVAGTLVGGTALVYQCREVMGAYLMMDDSVEGPAWPYVVVRYEALMDEARTV